MTSDFVSRSLGGSISRVIGRTVLLVAGIASGVACASDSRYDRDDRYTSSRYSSERSYERGYDETDVVDVRPIYQTVRYAEPREVCYDERVRDEGRSSATAPILGAVIGGAIGNAVGHHKTNKRVGTVVGALLGGAVGYDISRRDSSGGRYRTESVCGTENDYREEERITGYDVTYRYAGETYTTRMSRDPGSHLRVRVHVTPVEGGYNNDDR